MLRLPTRIIFGAADIGIVQVEPVTHIYGLFVLGHFGNSDWFSASTRRPSGKPSRLVHSVALLLDEDCARYLHRTLLSIKIIDQPPPLLARHPRRWGASVHVSLEIVAQLTL